MSELLDVLEREGLLEPLDVELARTLARLGREPDERVLLAIALASRNVQQGHVCLDLGGAARERFEDATGSEIAQPPSRDAWLEALQRSPLVASEGACAGEARPLVLDADGRLYLARYHDHEQRVAEHLLRLARDEAAPEPTSEALLEQLFPGSHADGLNRQREAASASCARRLSIIVGGPGTGKTSTVVKLLAVLVHSARSRGRALPRVLLAAPTGKAAQRLSEAIERARDKLPVDDALRSAIPSQALTVHRALGPLGGSLTRFRHGPEHPLDCDVLLLDEASMVDLALMRRLLDAVPAHARVILLGDPDQLASVEAGGVLADICAAAEAPSCPLARCVSRLTVSYRYPEHSGIAALARAVHTAQPDEALAVLRAGHTDVSFHGPITAQKPGRAFEQDVRSGYRGLRDASLAAELAALDGFRVLTAHRLGPDGVEALNLTIAKLVRGRPTRAHESYPGRPILITHNDYAARLFNGDVGVLHAERRGRPLTACFPEAEARVRRVALGRLPAHESVYAMTVHKSQGSEFDRVAIVLPKRPSPVLTRELLYTAITRAKRSLSIYATEATLRLAIESRTTRASGLTARLTRQ